MTYLRKPSLDILFVGDLPPHPGGSGLSATGLLLGFAKAGHRIRCVSPTTADAVQGGDAFAERHPELGISRFTVPHFHYPHTPSSETYRRDEGEAARAAMSRLIAERRPDIVMVGRESFAWHVPDIVEAHGLPSIQRTAGGTTHGIARGNYPPALAQAYLQCLSRATRRVAPSRYLADVLRGLGIEDVVVILNAVDLQRFAPAPKDPALLCRLGLSEDDVVVMQPGTMKDMKRPMDVVHSAQKALQTNPKLTYLIVGDGDLRAAVEAACHDAGIAHRFRFTGQVDYAALPAYFQVADIVVMTSEFEGLSRVYVETQACGRTLIASDVPCLFEVVTPGENGLAFRTGDIDELTDKTLQAAADPVLRGALGRQGRARMERFHDLDRAVDAYLELFAETVRAFAA